VVLATGSSRGFVAGLIADVLTSLLGFVLFGPSASHSPPPTPEQEARIHDGAMIAHLQEENRVLRIDVERLTREMAKATGNVPCNREERIQDAVAGARGYSRLEPQEIARLK
jgi:hypothetical protein